LKHESGKALLYRIALRGGWIWVCVGSLDEATPPEFLFNTADGEQGWRNVRRFVAAAERSGLKSLRGPRPIELGEPGSPNSFVTG
jgi:hypothetical protein